MNTRTLLMLSMLGFMVAPSLAVAQERAAPPVPVVVTKGEGVVRAAPDRAFVTIAAESRARNPRDAQAQNARAMAAVGEKLKGAGIQADAMRTIAIDLQAEFDYVNNRQTLRGYVASNRIEVRVDDLARAGEILDLAVSAGATSLGGVRFDVASRDRIEREALRLAVADARARADAAAAGVGRAVDRVLRIEEERQGIERPPVPMIAMRAEAALPPTPVASGQIEVRAQVTLTASIR